MRINMITLWSFVIFGVTNVITGVVRSIDEYGLDAVWWSFPVGFAISAVASSSIMLSGNGSRQAWEREAKT